MNPIILIYLFIQCFFLALVGGFIFKWSPKPFYSYIKYALILSILTFFIRILTYDILNLSMPLHLILVIPLSVILMKYIFKIYTVTSLGSTLASYILIIIFDTILTPIVLYMFNWEIILVQKNFIQYIIMGLLTNLPLVLISVFIFNKKKGVIFDNKQAIL